MITLKKPQFKHLATVLIVSLLLGTAFMLVAQAQTPTSTFWISSGVYPAAPTYTAWREGSDYFAKNEQGQLSTSSGTNATTLVQSLIQPGVTILLKADLFEFDGPVFIDVEDVTITGVTESYGGVGYAKDYGNGTRINAVDITAFIIGNVSTNSPHANARGITIKNLGIYGNYSTTQHSDQAHYTDGCGIYVQAGEFLEFRNLYINRKQYGIQFASWRGLPFVIDWIVIENCQFTRNLYGIYHVTGWASYWHLEKIHGTLNQRSLMNVNPTYSFYASEIDSEADSWNVAPGNDQCPINVGSQRDIWLEHIFVDAGYGTDGTNATALMRIVLGPNGYLWLSDFALQSGRYNGLYVGGGPNNCRADISDFVIGPHGECGWRGDNGTISGSGIIIGIDYAFIGPGFINATGTPIQNTTVMDLDIFHVYDAVADETIDNVGWTSGTAFPTVTVYEGQQFYRTDLHTLYVWNSTDWDAVGLGGGVGPQGPPGTTEARQPYDYLVFRNATSTYMINGVTGAIDDSGTPSNVINNAVGNGTDILLSSNTFQLTADTGIDLDVANTVLRGSGHNTIITCESDLDDHIIDISASGCKVKNLKIDGGDIQDAAYDGIYVGATTTWIEDVNIEDCGRDGIRVGDPAGGHWYAGKISHVRISSNGEYGLYMTYDATDWEIHSFLINSHTGTGDAGIRLEGTNNRFTNGHLWGNYYELIVAEAESVRGALFSNVIFADGGEGTAIGTHRVYHTSANSFRDSTFVGCEFWSCYLAGSPGTYSGMYLDGTTYGISITGNIFRGADQDDTPKEGLYGIFLDASSHNITIVANVFHFFADADPIKTTGAADIDEGHNIILDCG